MKAMIGECLLILLILCLLTAIALSVVDKALNKLDNRVSAIEQDVREIKDIAKFNTISLDTIYIYASHPIHLTQNEIQDSCYLKLYGSKHARIIKNH